MPESPKSPISGGHVDCFEIQNFKTLKTLNLLAARGVDVEADVAIRITGLMSEFEIARWTKNYRAVLQALPSIFVGEPDRLQHIVFIVSDAAKQSLKKKGMHFPPWRKAEYMRAKWLSPHIRTSSSGKLTETETETESKKKPSLITTKNFSGEFELIFEEKSSLSVTEPGEDGSSYRGTCDEEKIKVLVSEWKPPAIKPRSSSGGKMVTGLASVLKEKP